MLKSFKNIFGSFFIVMFLVLVFPHSVSAAPAAVDPGNAIKVVMDDNYPPYAFRDSSGNLQGILVDQWMLWEKKTGIKSYLTGMDWGMALQKMKQGEFDVIDTVFLNEERESYLDFTKAYAKIEVPIFFRNNISGITGAESLKGFNIGVKGADNAIKILKEEGVDNIAEFSSFESIAQAAKNQEIMAFVMDKPSALYYLYKFDIQEKFSDSKPLYTGDLCRAVNEGNTKLLSTVEHGFTLLSQKETDDIDRKWLGSSQVLAQVANEVIIAFFAILVAVMLLLVWNFILDKKVKEKTVELSNALEKLTADIAVRKKAEVALKESENRISAFLKAIPDMFFLFDREGRFVDYYVENENELYKTPIEFLGRKMTDVFEPKVFCMVFEGMERLLQSGETQAVEYSLTNGVSEAFYEARLVLCGEDKVLAVVRNITHRKKSEAKLLSMSICDTLTGLFNRNYFETELDKYQGKDLTGMAIVICDVDGLKLINDTLGHASGDDYLKTAADILYQCFSDGNMVARIGGDEFAVLMKYTNTYEVLLLKQKVDGMLKELNSDNWIIPMSMSLGYAVGNENQKDLRVLFKIADNMMYREKLHHRQSEKSKNIDILTKLLSLRDFITEGHGERMQDLCYKLAKTMDMSESDIRDIRIFAQFHDIGKVGIPDRILFKAGRLTEEEMGEMKHHTEIGYRIAEASPDLIHISDWVLKHHEWWDGSGYPFKLKGDEIPLQCRILSVVDAYDAMTSDQPYRKAMSKDEALEEIVRFKGRQFDPMLVDKFIEMAK